MGHFTYECKGDRVYVARESRGTVLKKKAKEIEKEQRETKSKKQEMEEEEAARKVHRNGLADQILLDKQRERMEKEKRQQNNDDDVSSATTSSLDSSEDDNEDNEGDKKKQKHTNARLRNSKSPSKRGSVTSPRSMPTHRKRRSPLSPNEV